MLEVHYNTMNTYKEENFKLKEDGLKPTARQQADTLGWLMMAIGVNEITKKTVDEMLFRTRFLDFVWSKSYFSKNPNDNDLRKLFERHLGLKIVITNRGLKDKSTRHKFMVNQLNSIERNILNKINN
jgi:hypothetical protein|tara:strand:+ start:116 stop:496 length:381 start_codon:yes stop_codon:yes gene_type:complete